MRLFQWKVRGAPKKFKTHLRPMFRSSSAVHFNNSTIYLVTQSFSQQTLWESWKINWLSFYLWHPQGLWLICNFAVWTLHCWNREKCATEVKTTSCHPSAPARQSAQHSLEHSTVEPPHVHNFIPKWSKNGNKNLFAECNSSVKYSRKWMY
jgi:hypothetical protein